MFQAFNVYANTPDFDEELNRQRFEEMSNIVEMRYTEEVQTIIKNYLIHRRDVAEDIISRLMLYSPIFDYYFEKYDLPKELKYLAIIESRLEPKAKSRVGALGIWQLMAPTAKELGLRIYHSVDERRDVYSSTDAACRYLKKLYNRFGDWTLAIAAYNTGQGRVSRILRESGGSSYWDIQDLLPKETSIYVPAFIAATYVFGDFNAHGLIPHRFHPDQHFTTKVKIFNHKVYLNEVARLLKIDPDTLYLINPAYKKNYIPSSPRGYNLVVPTRTRVHLQYLLDTLTTEHDIRLSAMKSFPGLEEFETDSLFAVYLQTEYIVRQDERLSDICAMFELEEGQLKYWNNLRTEALKQGMILDIPIPIISGKFLMCDLVGLQEVIDLEYIDLSQLKNPLSIGKWVSERAILDINKATVLYQSEMDEANKERIRVPAGIPIQRLSSLLDKKIHTESESKNQLVAGFLMPIED
jgi:membrane-bound lytic murein transglycosylase D